jgi:hypothetical protein
VDLHTSTVRGKQLEGQAAVLDRQDRLVGGGGWLSLDDGLFGLTGLRVGIAQHDQEALRRLPGVHAPRAFPVGVAYLKPTAEPEVAFHLAVLDKRLSCSRIAASVARGWLPST